MAHCSDMQHPFPLDRLAVLVGFVLGLGACASSPDTSGGSGPDKATSPPPASEREQTQTSRESTSESTETPSSTSSDKSTEKASSGATSESTSDVSPSRAADQQLERLVERIRKGDSSEARDQLEQLAEHPEKGYLAAYNLGVLAEQKGKIRTAAKQYNRAIEKKTDFSPALGNLVRLYLREGRIDDADRVAQTYIDQASDNLDHKAVRLEVLLVRERYQDVIRRAKDILRRDQKNVQAMLAMATANYELDRLELARAVLERASELAPERADLYFQFGLIAMENDKRGRAIANFKRAIKARPRFAEAHNNLGLLYHEAGDYEAALERFKAALAVYPSFKKARLNLGNAYKRLGQPKEAQKQFEKLLEMDSDYADAHYNLGLLYMDTKVAGMDKIPRLEKAIETFNEYKSVARRSRDDESVDKYISSARDKIKAEKQRRKMMRQTQRGGGGGSGNSDGNQDSQDSKQDGDTSGD